MAVDQRVVVNECKVLALLCREVQLHGVILRRLSLRLESGDIWNQAFLKSHLLQFDGHSPNVDHQTVDRQDPHQGIFSESTGQGPFRRHGSHLEKITDFPGLVLPGAFADPEEFIDGFRLAVRRLGRIIQKIDAADRVHGSGCPDMFFAL